MSQEDFEKWVTPRNYSFTKFLSGAYSDPPTAYAWAGYQARQPEIDALQAEVELLRKDAERYQWLRDPAVSVGLVLDKVVGEVPSVDGIGGGGYRKYEYRAGIELDTAIDAAMKEQK